MKSLDAFCLGAAVYPMLELIWRGKTHWTMGVVGGLACVMTQKISGQEKSFSRKCLTSAGAITLLELCSGCLLNRALKLDIWDYSRRPIHLLGQITPAYSLLWLLLSAPMVALFQEK